MMPPLHRMIWDALKTFTRVLRGAPQGIIVDAPFQERRLSICESCEWFVSESKRCQQCGCLMTIKVTLKQASCPIHKWEVEQ